MAKRNPLKRKPPKEGRLQKQKQKQYVRQNVVVNLQQPIVKRARRRTTNIRKNIAEQAKAEQGGRSTTSSAITNVYTTVPYTNIPSRDEVLREVRAEIAEGNRIAALDAQKRAVRTLQQEEINSASYRSGEAAPSPMRVEQPQFEDLSPPPIIEEPPQTPNVIQQAIDEAVLPPSGGADVARAPENPLAPERKRRGPKTDADKAAELGMSVDEYKLTKSTKKAQREAQKYEDLGESASQIEAPTRPSLFELATGMSSLKPVNPLRGGGASSAPPTLLQEITAGKKLKKTSPLSGGSASVVSRGSSAPPTLLQEIAAGGKKLKKTSPLAERKQAGKTPSEVSTSLGAGFSAMVNDPFFKMRQRQAEEEDNNTIRE